MKQLQLAEKIACADALPVYKGVYRVYRLYPGTKLNDESLPVYSYWNGANWSYCTNNVQLAEDYKKILRQGDCYPITSWQGLAHPPVGDWVKGSVKPIYPGVYQRKMPSGNARYARWTGTRWMLGKRSAELAEKTKITSPNQDCLKWRGLTQPMESY